MKCCEIVVLYRELKYGKISWNTLIKVVILREICSFLQIKFIVYTESIYMAQNQNVESRCFLTARLLPGDQLTLFL